MQHGPEYFSEEKTRIPDLGDSGVLGAGWSHNRES
jgi:hypothetical protein